MVIALSNSSAGLGDHGGGHNSPNPRQRAEDRNVAVLAPLVIVVIRGRKLVEQRLDASATALALAVDQAQAWQEQREVFGGHRDHAGRDMERGHPQRRNNLCRVQSANTVLPQQPLDPLGPQALGNPR